MFIPAAIEYKLVCDQTHIKPDGKTRVMKSVPPIGRNGSMWTTLYNDYESAANALQKAMAGGEIFEKHQTEMQKRFPDLVTEIIHQDNYGILMRHVEAWHI